MIFDAKNPVTLAGVTGNISSSDVNLFDLNVEKMEINVKEQNLKEQFKRNNKKNNTATQYGHYLQKTSW